MTEIPEHDQRITIRLLRHYPAHEPRASDPHYHAFEALRHRLKQSDLWHCNVPGDTHAGTLELHHSHVEFAVQNAIDIERLNDVVGLHLDELSFKDWIESEGNTEILCQLHHTGILGVHLLPEPDWNAIRCQRDGVPLAQIEQHGKDGALHGSS